MLILTHRKWRPNLIMRPNTRASNDNEKHTVGNRVRFNTFTTAPLPTNQSAVAIMFARQFVKRQRTSCYPFWHTILQTIICFLFYIEQKN